MATIGLTEQEREQVERFRREVIEPSQTSLVILDFFATWCGPCTQLTPVLEKVAADYADKGVVLRTLDIDADRLIADQFRIQSVPTVYALFGGQPVADLTAYRSEGQLKRVLDQLLAQLPVSGAAQDRAAEIAPLLDAGEAMLDTGAHDEALALFTQLEAMDPGNPAILGGLARALIAAGETEAARAAIESAGEEAARHPALSRARAALDVAVPVAAAAPIDTAAQEAALAADPDDHAARYELAMARIAGGDRDGAADALLEIIARARDWNDGAARAKLLTLIEAAGMEDPWARGQRRRLSAILFT